MPRTFSNIAKEKNVLQTMKTETVNSKTHITNKDESIEESNDYEQQDNTKMSQKRNSADEDAFEDNKENIVQHTHKQDHNKPDNKRNSSRFKKCKVDETKNIDETFVNVSNAIINLLQCSKENNTNDVKTIDEAFVDYVRIHLENISEPEKSARKKLIIDALTEPLH